MLIYGNTNKFWGLTSTTEECVGFLLALLYLLFVKLGEVENFLVDQSKKFYV